LENEILVVINHKSLYLAGNKNGTRYFQHNFYKEKLQNNLFAEEK